MFLIRFGDMSKTYFSSTYIDSIWAVMIGLFSSALQVGGVHGRSEGAVLGGKDFRRRGR
jgi:hypothetical protein